MPSIDSNWHTLTGDEQAKCLTRVFESVVEQSTYQREAHEYHVALYAGEAAGTGVRGHTMRGAGYLRSTLPDNVCRSLVDTLQAKIGKVRPLPRVMTSRGNWKNQRRAKKMKQFIEGVFYNQRVFEELTSPWIRDAAVCGNGYLAVMIHGDAIVTERVHPWELFVDEWDGRYGKPRNLYRCRTVDAGVLAKLYGHEDAIKVARGKRWIESDDYATGMYSETTDRVDVLEAWHLCDDVAAHAPGKKVPDHDCTGRHVVAIQGHVLVSEPFRRGMFPIARLSYCDPITGYFGSGLVEQLEGYQHEINAANEKLAEQHRLSGALVTLPDGGDVTATEINNDVGTILHTTPGVEPKVWQMDLVSQTLSQRPAELSERARNNAGISQMAAQSQKPSGITSGVALQTLDDVETERFVIFGRQYEGGCLDLSRIYLDCATEIAEEHGDMAVGVPLRSGAILDLSWKDVVVDGFQLRIFPSSELPTKPAAQLERLTQMFDSGQWDVDSLYMLSDNPDVQSQFELLIAHKLVVRDMVERMCDADEDTVDAYLPPTPYQDYEWAAKYTQQVLNAGLLEGMPELNQQLLRDYIADNQAELEKLAPPPAAPAPMPMADPNMPPAMPAAPPLDPMSQAA